VFGVNNSNYFASTYAHVLEHMVVERKQFIDCNLAFPVLPIGSPQIPEHSGARLERTRMTKPSRPQSAEYRAYDGVTFGVCAPDHPSLESLALSRRQRSVVEHT